MDPSVNESFRWTLRSFAFEGSFRHFFAFFSLKLRSFGEIESASCRARRALLGSIDESNWIRLCANRFAKNPNLSSKISYLNLSVGQGHYGPLDHDEDARYRFHWEFSVEHHLHARRSQEQLQLSKVWRKGASLCYQLFRCLKCKK